MKFTHKIILTLLLSILAYILWSKYSARYRHTAYEGQWIDIYKNLQSALIAVNDNDTISIPAGHYLLNRSLLMDGKSNVVIKGEGIDKTIISWIVQHEGSEGIKISNCKDIQLIDMTLEDAKGDIIKVSSTDGIRIHNVKAHWTKGPDESNGAYAFYPVLCKRVLIENCIAACASDAGIYVGQSDSVMIRNNTVFKNVAGIESENSKYVTIKDNYTYDNTGGILVFDLPGLTQYGHTTLVKNNKIKSNNHRNFAPKGNIVGMVPPGTGIMLLATRNICIEHNEIVNNKTASCAVISYDLVEAMNPKKETKEKKDSAQPVHNNYKLDSLYDPYPNDIFIHQNKISNRHIVPTLSSDFGLLFLSKFTFKTPKIIIDGFSNIKLKKFNFCYEGEPTSFANLDVPHEFKNIEKDIAAYKCSGNRPNEVVISFPKISK
jgi:parallel beta-helix repeat protein